MAFSQLLPVGFDQLIGRQGTGEVNGKQLYPVEEKDQLCLQECHLSCSTYFQMGDQSFHVLITDLLERSRSCLAQPPHLINGMKVQPALPYFRKSSLSPQPYSHEESWWGTKGPGQEMCLPTPGTWSWVRVVGFVE